MEQPLTFKDSNGVIEDVSSLNSDKLTKGKQLAKLIYALMGVGLLFPWNAFLTAIDYLEILYPDKHADRTFTVVYMPINVLVLVLIIHFNALIKGRTRVIASFVGYTITMIVVPVLDASFVRKGDDGEEKGTDFTFALTCLAVAMAGLCDGLGQGALFGETARLTPEFTQALVQGTALSGIAASFLRIITKASMDSNERGSAMLYFSISVLFTFTCTILYSFYLPQIPYIKHNLERVDSVEFVLQTQSVRSIEDGQVIFPLANYKSNFRYLTVFQKVWKEALSLVVIYVITLSIFPGVLAEDIESEALGSWYPILLIALFNFADFVGKSMPPFNFLSQTWLILICSISRIFFVPIYAISAHYKMVDWWFFIWTFLLGVSNGYLTDLAMMAAPLKVKQAALQEIVGNVMVLGLVTGLLIGAILGWVWVWV
eukprot:TRINITY_DN2958_c0_g1_i6.p1 TRINITY_DN2958_c0_g1~~TRINITY_DN2958_c0_g1_i6.p1  ORF type:complete len:429 (+),score=37.34 TRINITY_DN2958_c0_g1_i6:86-1372(+)